MQKITLLDANHPTQKEWGMLSNNGRGTKICEIGK